MKTNLYQNFFQSAIFLATILLAHEKAGQNYWTL